MLKYTLSLFCLTCCFISYSQRVHTISVIQKRIAVEKDRATLEHMKNSIARFTDFTDGKSLDMGTDESKTITELKNFFRNVSKEDILLFYFSGTGKYVKLKGKDELNMDIGGGLVPVKEIIDLVKERSPRTSIILVECALREIEKDNDGNVVGHANIITKGQTKKLFLVKDKRQLICIKAASPPKQPIHRSAILGSFFLQSFKNNLYEEMGLEGDINPNWKNIMRKTEKDISGITRNGQIPIGSYEQYD